MHGSLAIYCYQSKQPFAALMREHQEMKKHDINEVLASNLDQAMKERGIKQPKLASMSGVAQTTISLYLHPERRRPGASGKPPSGKLAEVEALASALGMPYWELMMPASPEHRALLRQFSQLVEKVETPSAPNGQEASAKPQTADSGKRKAA